MGFDQKLFGIIYFFTGLLLAYYTYPFFSALITGFSATSWAGWPFVQAILWVGYGVSLVNWLLLIPFLTITKGGGVHPFTFLKTIGYLFLGVGFIYVSYPLATTLLGVLDPLINLTDWDTFTYLFWIFYVGIMLLILVGAPLRCVFAEDEY